MAAAQAHQQNPAERQPGRNIVLLSDGTGNSAAKLAKTNVWRLYQSLVLEDERQLAFYDDGVGTSGFKPLQIAGGAFGIGLARNVRELYTHLCQHYRPPGPTYAGDRIYLFGFSRGAFTVRILADLIASCGIVDLNRAGDLDQPDLDTLVHKAYRSYHRKGRAPWLAGLWRGPRDLLLGPVPDHQVFRQRYSHSEPPPLEFIGVWDTVAAYGLPMEELSAVINLLFYKLRFDDQDLSPHVTRACQAVAIDDERQSFHPLLWNEPEDAVPGRIQQVWFAGMHSDVGGGYANDNLSFISFNWMVNQIKSAPDKPNGLLFDERALQEYQRRANSAAPMHDSRAGLGNYYRYRPRILRSLCKDPVLRVGVEDIRIHKSVFQRIRQDTESYAPAGIPSDYTVIDSEGRVLPSPEPGPPHELQRRMRAQHRAALHIFWRRVNYLLMVLVSALLLAMPLYLRADCAAPPTGPLRLLDGLLGLLGTASFGLLDPMKAVWLAHPLAFVLLVALLTGLILYARRVQRRINCLLERGWWHLKSEAPFPGLPEPGPFERLAEWLYQRGWLPGLGRAFSALLSFGLVLALGWGLYAAAGHLGSPVADVAAKCMPPAGAPAAPL